MSLNELFVPQDDAFAEDTPEKIIRLTFCYAGKNYSSSIDLVKEITDFPFTIPFPHETCFIGVFNLRGTIVPILDPMKESSAKRRLVIFELLDGNLVALPSTKIAKVELDEASAQPDSKFITIDGLPYACFDIIQFLEEWK